MTHRQSIRWPQLLKVCVFIIFLMICMYHETIERYKLKTIHNHGTPWTGMTPAGEITSSFHLRQSVRFDTNDLGTFELDAPVCLDIQFVTYRRKNQGQFRVRLSAGDAVDEQVLEAKPIVDNALQLVCFDKISFDQIYHHDAWLEIEGIDGVPHKSVSAVLSAVEGPARAHINGQPTDSTLVYVGMIRKDPELHQINSYVLIIFAGLAMTLMMAAARPRQDKSLTPTE